MTLALLSLGAAIVLGMVGLSQYGWRVLPADATMPLRIIPVARARDDAARDRAGTSNWVPKRTGLLAYPSIGLIAYLITSATLAAQGKADLVAVPAALVILSLMQYRAIHLAQVTATGRDRIGS